MQDKGRIRIGDRVIFTNDEAHAQCPRWYPPAGTVGKVLRVGAGTAWVQWPAGCTSDSGRWYAPLCELVPYRGRLRAWLAAAERVLDACRSGRRRA